MLIQAVIIFCSVIIVSPVVFFTVALLCDRYLVSIIHPESLVNRLYKHRCGK